MAQTTKRVDAVLEAARVKWGKTHCRTITAAANTANVLAGKYLPVNYLTPNLVEVLGYVWFADGVGTDPTPNGYTLIGSVSVTSGDSAAVVASALKTTLDAAVVSGTVKAFKASTVLGAVVQVENKFIGPVTAETDPNITGFTRETLVEGAGLDLGATSDGIELSLEAQVVDITSNQTGGIIASQVYTGSSASLTLNLLEVSKERFDLLVGSVTGDSVTPLGGTKVSGYGESRLFQSLDDLGGQLILHPIRLADSDLSSDVIFWKSAPKPQTLNFDGTAPQVMAVEFTAYLDLSKDKKINLFAKGDWTQDLEA
jgi:hypothetical protein